jgi:hypothetical protein
VALGVRRDGERQPLPLPEELVAGRGVRRPNRPAVVGLRRRVASGAGMAAASEQPRQLTQGIQRHLHGSNEDDEPWPEAMVVCPRGGFSWKGTIGCSYAIYISLLNGISFYLKLYQTSMNINCVW